VNFPILFNNTLSISRLFRETPQGRLFRMVPFSVLDNRGELGTWNLQVCRNPQALERELEYICKQPRESSMSVGITK
jgi:hypothetical protein